jgi:transcription elongation factor SPT5
MQGDVEFPPKTPIWGSSLDATRTPMRTEDGMATPLRMRGSNTPIHGTAWDPTQPNTPMRTSTPSWDPDFSSSSNWQNSHDYSISTPGFSGYSPFSPARGAFSGDTPESQNPATPTGGFAGPGTPGSAFTPTTGVGAYGIEREQHHNFHPNRTPTGPVTPSDLTPNTPGVPYPNTPGTPGDSLDLHLPGTENSNSADSNWHTEDIQVKVVNKSFRNGEQYLNEEGVIKRVNKDGTCDVKMKDGLVVIPKDCLEAVLPRKKDTIKIIRGDYAGGIGTLIGIDGADGIVKMTVNLDIKILDLHHLAIYVPQ